MLASSLSIRPPGLFLQFVQYAAPSENHDLLRQQFDAASSNWRTKRRYSGLVAMHNEQMEQSGGLMPGCMQSRTTAHWQGQADDRLSLCSRNNQQR